jgi:UDP-GlcNAc3NAcA epimerase
MKIVTIIGARPQFIKAAVLSNALRNNNIQEVILHTGQHYDANMSKIFFDEMQIPAPDYQLNINSLNHGAMTGRMLEDIEKILFNEKPDFVLVYGDTNSTLAGALAAKKLLIKIIHVEAGLRSFNMSMPEEINRILTDRISDLLFCPTQTAIDNLVNEGMLNNTQCKIELVGDVMYDSYLHFSAMQCNPSGINSLNKFALVTIHRAENTNNLNQLTNIVSLLNEISKHINLLIPLHPRTQKILADSELTLNATIIEPVGYLEMLWLLNNCNFVITDSGGLQKEAYFAKKKCITLREETEWVELVTGGWNQLINPIRHIEYSQLDLSIPQDYPMLYGDGDCCKKIVTGILSCVE